MYLHSCSAVVVSSSCSTDETIVADSEDEVETATSVHEITAVSSEEPIETVAKIEEKMDQAATTDYFTSFRPTTTGGGIPAIRDKVDEPEIGNSDIIYSQDLFVRDINMPSTSTSTINFEVLNFKCFRKVLAPVFSISIDTMQWGFQLDLATLQSFLVHYL